MVKRLFRSDIDNSDWLEETDKEDTVITDWELNILLNDIRDEGVTDFVASMPKELQAMVKAWAKKHYFDYYFWKED